MADEALHVWLRGDLAPSTERRYALLWARFATWCQGQGICALPAHALDIARFLHHLSVESGPHVARGAFAALCRAHVQAGLPSPENMPLVAAARRALSDQLRGHVAHGRRPLMLDELRLLGQHLTTVAKQPERRFVATRTRALIVVGWWAALRRSELVAIRDEDSDVHWEGIILTVRTAKRGEAGTVGMPCCCPDAEDVCPVAALKCWLELRDRYKDRFQVTGILFQKLDGEPLAPASVNTALRNAARGAGLDFWQDYGAHSLRSGFATEAARGGKSLVSIMQHGRWGSTAGVAPYIRRGTALGSDNPAHGLTTTPRGRLSGPI